MKILHVIETLGVGGAEQVLVTLLPELNRIGVETEVAVLRPPYSLQSSLKATSIAVHRLTLGSHWNLVTACRQLSRVVRTSRCEIIHAHLLFPGIYTGLLRLFSATRSRTAITFHNLAYAPGCNRPGTGLAARKMLNRIVATYGLDLKIAVSHAAAAHYQAKLGLDNVAVIPNPVSVAAIDAARRAAAASGVSADPVVVVPGRLVHEKGHDEFLRALSLLLSRHGATPSVILAGGGPLRHHLEKRIVQLGLAAAVTITGELEHSSMIATLAKADLVVIPSRFEGFGLAAAEAMCLEKAVVATRVGGLPDVVSDGVTGLLVESGDTEALASAIAGLLSNAPRRASFGAAGRIRVEREFDAPIVAARTKALYVDLLSKPH